MIYIKKKILLISLTLSLILNAGCVKENYDEVKKREDDVSVSDEQQVLNQTVVPKQSQDLELEPQKWDDYEEYIKDISNIPAFEPYYKTVIAFEELPDGITSLPIEKVKAMYAEMKTVFDYVLVSEHPLIYRGYYEGETSFVDGYEEYENGHFDIDIPNPVNVVWKDWEGNEIIETPLKTVLLGESVFNRFDHRIEEGRNLQKSDFKLASPNDPISVVLGNAYKDVYQIGDIVPLALISEVMDFKVVGFYESGVGFSMEVGALHDVNFDYTIIMPHFIPDYEPIGEASIFQHAFHIGELTSGYISIPEQVEKINDDTYNRTVKTFEEMAERNGLSGLYKIPYLPVGFVW